MESATRDAGATRQVEMPRPRKDRRLRHEPRSAVFKPVGMRLESLECTTLLHEELEALRLADIEGLYQEQAAQEMDVSRSTFQRILTDAHRKVALSLVEGKALHIEGGNFRVAAVRWRCSDCGHSWHNEHGSGQGNPVICPSCGGHDIRERRGYRRRHGRR